MKIYTKTGDDGSTGLPGGKRVSKAAIVIDGYGAIDELNAALGLAAVAAPAPIAGALTVVQHSLFDLGVILVSSTVPAAAKAPHPDEQTIASLEHQIDVANAQLPPLNQFILPGGCEAAARLHLARTICRRAERVVVSLAENHPVPPMVLAYLNRLSDWLFVQARLANHLAGVGDVHWRNG